MILVRDQLTTKILKCHGHEINPLYQIGTFARGMEQQDGRPSLLGFRFSFSPHAPQFSRSYLALRP